jgi:hypothetical protein
MRDAKTGSSWSQKARGGKDSIENRRPEGFINGPLKNDICRDVGAFSDQIKVSQNPVDHIQISALIIILDKLFIHWLELKSLYSILYMSETKLAKSSRWAP